jgi:hypothetical protein
MSAARSVLVRYALFVESIASWKILLRTPSLGTVRNYFAAWAQNCRSYIALHLDYDLSQEITAQHPEGNRDNDL